MTNNQSIFCDKLAFDSAQQAWQAIDKMRNNKRYEGKSRTKPIAKNAYLCKHCGKWHITSKKKFEWK